MKIELSLEQNVYICKLKIENNKRKYVFMYTISYTNRIERERALENKNIIKTFHTCAKFCAMIEGKKSEN